MKSIRILHYILGVPPIRSGGLTRYATSLISTQKNLGYNVSVIWPGNRFPLAKKMNVKHAPSYNDIPCYKIKNALPVPLLHGIKNAHDFCVSEMDSFSCFDNFFKENDFRILHIHTMMGLPLSFLMAAKKNNVKIVYTSHDYFALCPRVNFIDSSGFVCDGASPEKCSDCNRNAKSRWFLWLRNSHSLLSMKKILKR